MVAAWFIIKRKNLETKAEGSSQFTCEALYLNVNKEILDDINKIHPSTHPSNFNTIYLQQCCTGFAGAYPSGLWAESGLHPEQAASQTQGTQCGQNAFSFCLEEQNPLY